MNYARFRLQPLVYIKRNKDPFIGKVVLDINGVYTYSAMPAKWIFYVIKSNIVHNLRDL